MTTIDNYIIHNTQYHETDQMGVIHHANYVKWMEEARNMFFDSIGINLVEMERNNNVFMPVLFESVNYIKAAKYDEKIKIICECIKFNGIKVEFEYTFHNMTTNELCAYGRTSHGFVDKTFKPIIFKDLFKKEYKILKENINCNIND